MNQLKAMKQDEKKAPGDYAKLLKQVKFKKDKKIIKRIIKDERKPLRLLKKIRSYG